MTPPPADPVQPPPADPVQPPPADPVHQYLNELRARLRSADASLILAEAEDHLREAVTAGWRPG